MRGFIDHLVEDEKGNNNQKTKLDGKHGNTLHQQFKCKSTTENIK